MSDVWLIAARELTERLRSRTFLLSNAAILALLTLSLVLPLLLRGDGVTRLAVVGSDAQQVAQIATDQQVTFGVKLDIEDVPSNAAAEHAVGDGDVGAAVLDDMTVLVERSLDDDLEALLTTASNALRVERLLVDAGLDAQERAELAEVEPLTVRSRDASDEGVDSSSPAVAVAFVGVFILYGLLILYGQWVAQGIVEEKQSRVVEVLLATVQPVHLLAGKILGLGLLGLAQMVLLAAVGITGLLLTDAVDLPRSGYASLVLVIAWYIPGYLLYATLFAIAGAVVARVEDLQSAVMPVIIVLVLALFGAQAALAAPTSTVATVMGLMPFTAPIVQPVLAASGAMSAWDMALAAVLAIATIAALLPLCGRIYRGGVLATRGRVSFLSAWRSSRARVRVDDRS